MNGLKKIKLTGMVLLAGALSPAIMANNSVILYQAAYYDIDGGEFTAVVSPGINLSEYSAFTKDLGGHNPSFQTFCVQTSTDFLPGATYSYTVSLQSVGGPGYPGGASTLGSPNQYALTEGTAWLYSQFARGLLGDYDYSNSGGGRATDAGLLQAAIWALQSQDNLVGGFPDGEINNPYYIDAYKYFGSSLATLNSAATLSDNFGVEIMNLSSYPTASSTANYQNQLILVPDSGSTMMLLGTALTGLAMLRRRV